MAPWSMATTPSRPDTEPWMSELLPDPATPVTTTRTPSGISTETSCRLLVLALRTSNAPLGVAARQGARRSGEAEVAKSDLHERIERLPQSGEQRRYRWLVKVTDPVGEIADLHRACVGDVDALDTRRPGTLVEPCPVALG